jgi:sulfur relay (sulfurtransferase) complex TusBCD TusD component (DsrE family)
VATLTIILTDGPYISQYAEMGYKIARAAMHEDFYENIVKLMMNEGNRSFIF